MPEDASREHEFFFTAGGTCIFVPPCRGRLRVEEHIFPPCAAGCCLVVRHPLERKAHLLRSKMNSSHALHDEFDFVVASRPRQNASRRLADHVWA